MKIWASITILTAIQIGKQKRDNETEAQKTKAHIYETENRMTDRKKVRGTDQGKEK